MNIARHIQAASDVGAALAAPGAPDALAFAAALGALEADARKWPRKLRDMAGRVLADCRADPAKAKTLLGKARNRMNESFRMADSGYAKMLSDMRADDITAMDLQTAADAFDKAAEAL